MTDITLEQRARVLLAAEFRKDGFNRIADDVLNGHPASSASVRAIEAALRLPAGEGWQPIETAPRDGVLHLRWSERWGFVCANEPPGYYPGAWHHVRGRKWSGSSSVSAEDATHWQPLPAAPRHEPGEG